MATWCHNCMPPATVSFKKLHRPAAYMLLYSSNAISIDSIYSTSMFSTILNVNAHHKLIIYHKPLVVLEVQTVQYSPIPSTNIPMYVYCQ